MRDAVGGVLRLPADQIDRHRPFGSLGLDSLMALELRNRLERALQRPLSATLAWNYPTVDALAGYLDALVAPRRRRRQARDAASDRGLAARDRRRSTSGSPPCWPSSRRSPTTTRRARSARCS